MIPGVPENAFASMHRVRPGESHPSRAGPECAAERWHQHPIRPFICTKANGADPKVDPTLTVAWSSRRKRLARCLCRRFPTEVGSVRRCHRCSHRHPVPSGGRSGSEDPFLFRQAVPRPAVHWPSASNGCVAPAEAFATPPRRRTGRTGRWWLASRSPQTTDLALDRSPLHGDLKDRADSCRHHDRVKKTSNFQAVRLVRSVASAPSR